MRKSGSTHPQRTRRGKGSTLRAISHWTIGGTVDGRTPRPVTAIAAMPTRVTAATLATKRVTYRRPVTE